MTSCAVPGCSSDLSLSSDCTFHRLPSSLIPRSRWILAFGPLPSGSFVCSLHFDPSMFTMQGGQRVLKSDAVPMLSLETSQSTIAPCEPVAACRACLATGVKLHALGSRLENALATLAGATLFPEENFPRDLCVYCLAKLSKCVAFRDSCQRSTALLTALLERGSLKISEIKDINRNTHQLKHNLTRNRIFQFGTGPLADTPEIKTEDDENTHRVPNLIDIEYVDSEEFVKNDGTEDTRSFEVTVEKQEVIENGKEKSKPDSPRYKRVFVKTEDHDSNSEIDDNVESKVDVDIDSDSSGETLAAIKKGKRKRIALEKKVKRPKKCRKSKELTDTEADSKPIRNKRRRGITCAEENNAFDQKYNCTTRVLNKDEQREEIENRKRSSKSAFVCDVCGKGYKKESTLMTHKTYHDSEGLPFECDVCRLRFRSRRSLLKHQDCHRATFTCNECGNVSRNRSHAKDHSLMHKGTTYTCPYCHIVYNHQTSYYNHIRAQHPGQNEACDECGETFAAGRGIMLHKALAHKKQDITNANTKCTECAVTFSSPEALKNHLESSVGLPHAAWPCAACGESCASETAREKHERDKHAPGEENYCKECDKTFANAPSFSLHVERKHKNRRAAEAPFRPRPGTGRVRAAVCEVCGKVYQNLTMLQYHMNSHLAVKPFQCPHCPKAFTHQSNHRLHMRVHTGERPYQCEQCPQAFSRRGNFTKHMKNVHERLQAKCEACGKLVGAASLASHVRAVHLRRPYARRARPRPDRKPGALV